MKKTLKKIILSVFVAVISLGLIFCLGFNAVCVESAMADAVNGGGFYVGSSATLTIEGKKNLSGFVASSNGGGIYSLGTLNINGGTISGNTATSLGGGVYSANNFTMTDGTISDNTAASGGGLAITSKLIYITGGTIAGNTATSNAGGLLVKGCGVDYKNGSITGNNADCGGGVGVDSGTFYLGSGSISGNKATTRGGGLYIFGGDSSSFGLTNGTISGNSAKYGGGVYLETGAFTMSGGTISGNTSTGAGSAIYVRNGKFTMDGGVIINNTSTSTSSDYDIFGGRGSSTYLNAGTVSGKIGGRGTFYVDIKNFNFDGTYKLREGATVIIKNYNGEKLNIENVDCTGAFLQFENCTSAPTLSNLSISGYDSDLYEVKLNQVNSTTYNCELVSKVSYNEPEGSVKSNVNITRGAGIFINTWYDEVYALTNIEPKALRSIQFRYASSDGILNFADRYDGEFVCLDGCESLILLGTMESGIKVCTCSGRHENLVFLYDKQIYACEVMENAFSAEILQSLKSLIFENFDTSRTLIMEGMFKGLNLQKLDLSGFNTEKTILYNGMFANCSIESLDISNFTIRPTVKINNVSNKVGVKDFLSLNAKVLKYLYTPKYVASSFGIRIGDATTKFYDAVGVDTYNDTHAVLLPDYTHGSRTYVRAVPTILNDSSDTLIQDIMGRYISSAETGMRIKFAFEAPETYCRLVETGILGINIYSHIYNDVSLPLELVIVSPSLFMFPKNSERLFSANSNISNYDKIVAWRFQNICTDAVEVMPEMFVRSKSLEHVYGLQNFHFTCLQTTTGMFAECSSLKTINFYEKQTAVMIREATAMFYGCSSLEYINMKGLKLDSSCTISDFLTGCTALNLIETPYGTNPEIQLPKTLSTAKGTEYTSIPANLSSSLMLMVRISGAPPYYDFADESTPLVSSDSVKKIDKINFWSGYSAFALICISAIAYPVYEDKKRRMKKR